MRPSGQICLSGAAAFRRRGAHRLGAVMAMKGRWLWTLAAAGLAVMLLAQAQTAADAVREGIELCLRAVIPSLFPFFAVSSLLVSLGAAEAAGRLLARPFGRLFRCGGAGCAALLLGLVGGYPVGARTAAALVRQGTLTREEGGQLLTFCNNAGPAFAVGVAGVTVFASARVGAYLYLIHIAAALATGLLLCRRGSPSPSAAVPAPAVTGLAQRLLSAVTDAAAAMGRVCAFVVFALVLLRLAETATGTWSAPAAGFVELTNGILRLTPDRRGFVTAAALLGWGGLSVYGQTAAVTAGSGIPLGRYLPAKAVQAALSAGLAWLAAPHLLP